MGRHWPHRAVVCQTSFWRWAPASISHRSSASSRRAVVWATVGHTHTVLPKLVHDSLWWGQSGPGNKLQFGSPVSFPASQRKGFSSCSYSLAEPSYTKDSSFSGRQLILPLTFLSLISTLLLWITTQHNGDASTHSYQISTPVRHILVSNSWSDIQRNSLLGLGAIGISQSTILLASCIPYTEVSRSSVGVEHKGTDLNTQGSYLLLKFTHQMIFNECSFSSATITNQYKFELNLGFSLGSHRDVTSRSLSGPIWLLNLLF